MRPFSFFPADYNAGITKYFHMMRKRRLTNLQFFQQFAGTFSPVRSISKICNRFISQKALNTCASEHDLSILHHLISIFFNITLHYISIFVNMNFEIPLNLCVSHRKSDTMPQYFYQSPFYRIVQAMAVAKQE